MTPKFDNDKEKIIVTLALIQQSLKSSTETIELHDKILFGNGTPQDSIIWNLKKLTENVSTLEKTLDNIKITAETTQKCIEELKKELERFKNNDENLSWSQWFKKVSMKWFPSLLIILVIIIVFYKPIFDLLTALVTLFT